MGGADPGAVALRLAADLAGARDERDAASAAARAAGQIAGADAVGVWLLDRQRGYRFAGAWPEAQRDEDPEPSADVARVIAFGAAAAGKGPRPWRSRLTLPLTSGLRPLGAIELFEKERVSGPFSPSDEAGLRDLVAAADAALVAVRERAAREQGGLAAITRLARLFDLTRSIVGATGIEDLSQVVVNRVQAAMEVDSAYLWLIAGEGSELEVAAAAGSAAEAVSGWRLAVGEGVAGRAAETGEALALDALDEDEAMAIGERPDHAAGVVVRSVAAAPVTGADGELLGVLEAVGRTDGEAFDKGDLAMLREIASSAGVALVNARRRDAERRAGDLSELIDVAQELGAHLDVSKVAFALVHRAATVIGYRRAALGLLRGSRLELAAVSGQTFVDDTLPEMRELTDLLAWLARLDDGVYVVREDDGSIDTERPETREKFRAWFERTGSRSFLTVPMADDEGRIGVLALEAAEPYAFSGRELEAAGLIAALATVALRNALLYESLPMVRVLRSRAGRRGTQVEGGAEPTWRRPAVRRLALVALVAVVLAVPVPLRIGGTSRVLPERRMPVTPAAEGRIADVLVREGDAVEAGAVLAVLDADDPRAAHEEALARYRVELRERDRDRALGLAAEAGVRDARLVGLAAEIDLWELRLEQTRLRAPAAGIVATPRVEERVGERLGPGEVFCEIVDPERQRIEIAVAEADAARLRSGQRVKVKLHAFPMRALRGTVERVGVTAIEGRGSRVLLVRTRLDDPGASLRAGMTGQAKIDTGRAPIARVLFRRPARWVWSLVWGWLP